MLRHTGWPLALALIVLLGAVAARPKNPPSPAPARVAARSDTIGHVVKTEEQWKKDLTPEQFQVLRRAGTETAFTGKYWDNHAAGTYYCAACHLELFESDTKFESGTGWPSFWAPVKGHVTERTDSTYGMMRTEVRCARCGGHLGHLFEDGPKPTGLRYCMNSAALTFEPAKTAK